MRFKDFELDQFQEKAVEAVEKGHSVLVSAPTGSGKTLIADYIIDRDIKSGKRVIYTAPIKALSNQKYKDFCNDYGEENIGLVTGDIVRNPSAQVLIMTTEVYRNMTIVKDPMLHDVSYCIMDEIHFISDEERGYVWEESIIFSPKNVKFIFLSATIPNAEEFADWVTSIKEDKVTVVHHNKRPVPLEIKFYDADLGMTNLHEIRAKKELDSYPEYDSVMGRKKRRRVRIKFPEFSELVEELKEKSKMPCIYFVFSRAKTQDFAQKLSKNQNFLSGEEKKQISPIITSEFSKISPDVAALKSSQILRQCLSKGIGFHHAGVLPDIKHIVEKLFAKGLVKVLFATETFAVGINMPAKSVCFDSLRKFTGRGFRYLNSKEFFQISGRAGRRGMDKTGLSVSMINRKSDDLEKIDQFTEKDDEPIQSQFKLSYNTVLNMVNLHNKDEINEILKMNFYTYQKKKGNAENKVLSSIRARFDNLVKSLKKMEYITESDELTHLGHFTTKIYANEIELSQVFNGNFDLDEQLILAIIAAISYEEKRGTEFYQTYPFRELNDIERTIRSHPILKFGKWYNNLEKVTAITQPCYHRKKFVDILKNTNLPEGDLIRILMQLLDRLEQVDRASDDERTIQMVRNCKDLIRDCLEGIHIF